LSTCEVCGERCKPSTLDDKIVSLRLCEECFAKERAGLPSRITREERGHGMKRRGGHGLGHVSAGGGARVREI
jgi:hypothetical protein